MIRVGRSVAGRIGRCGRTAIAVAWLRFLAGPASADDDVGRAVSPAARRLAEETFHSRVLLLFKERCLGCHGANPVELRGGLDLRSREAMLRGGESGDPAVVPGRPAESLLYEAVVRTGPVSSMPPKKNDRLMPAEIEAIRVWIDGGAPWPATPPASPATNGRPWEEADGVAVRTSGGLSAEWTNRRYKPETLWAYQPISLPEIPASDPARSTNFIDAFLSSRLTALGLVPAPAVDRRTLIRRATFDLIGLPPTPEEIDAFVNDPESDTPAFGKVVDRLLASPHYGEQWGRHWLDVTRYADSGGLANDYPRGNAWRYRDYVIRSFNADKPYDRFIREQLAGDEIAPDDPEMLIAAGFLRMGPWELTSMEVPKIARQRFLDDVTDTVGQVFLAHTLQCARCHDHKFDPVPTRDYYALQAVFATTQLSERPASFLPAENTSGFDERRYHKARQARCEATLKTIDDKRQKAAEAWCTERDLPYVPTSQGLKEGLPEEVLPPPHIGLDGTEICLERNCGKELGLLRWEFDRYEPVALSVYSGRTPNITSVGSPLRMPRQRLSAGDLERTCILAGGDPFAPRDPVAPAVLSAVAGVSGSVDSGAPEPVPTSIEGRRSALADWIASPQNPLTPRVMVNRIWLGHFGQALAGTPNNFGATGKRPTHPELLDTLAFEFVACGWSVKAMHRLMMMSEAYRRSSRHLDPGQLAAKDPDQISYAAFRPHRLAAEELRDAMLRVSGDLNLALGGIPVRPEMNWEVAIQPRQVMGSFAPAWQPSPKAADRNRRSIYALKLRGLRDPFLEVFDQPSPDIPSECRDSSTVTPQAFSMLNGDAIRVRALAFAARLLNECSTRTDAVERAFRLAFGRRPSEKDLRTCLAHWTIMSEQHSTLTFQPVKPPTEIVREVIDDATGERVKLTEVFDSTADFQSDLQPADATPELRGLMEVCLVLLNANEFISLD